MNRFAVIGLLASLILAGILAFFLFFQNQEIVFIESDAGGVVHKLDGKAVVKRQEEHLELLSGHAVHINDLIKTGENASIRVVFADGTSFELGPDAELLIDEFIYDAATEQGSKTVTILKGSFSFISGKIAKTDPQKMRVKTPTVELGVRGTKVIGEVSETGTSRITLIEGAVLLENEAGIVELSEQFETAKLEAKNSGPENVGILKPENIVAVYDTLFKNDEKLLQEFIVQPAPEVIFLEVEPEEVEPEEVEFEEVEPEEVEFEEVEPEEIEPEEIEPEEIEPEEVEFEEVEPEEVEFEEVELEEVEFE